MVVGGGPAGMMAAIAAAEQGNTHVTLLEQNEKLGKKLYLTGKGRCNLTNEADISEFFSNVIRNPKFLYSAFYGFTNEDVMRFFTEQGVYLKTERGRRVFPESDKSSDIIRALEKALWDRKVSVRLHEKVSSVGTLGNKVSCVRTKTQKYRADAVIMATGGLSYPTTGADGSGFGMVRALGHSTTEFSPALNGLLIKEPFVGQLSGLSVKNAQVSLVIDPKKSWTGFGEFLFTEHGVCGPLIFTASSVLSRELLHQEESVLLVDFKPALDLKTLNERLLRECEENPNAGMRRIAEHLLPKALALPLLSQAMVPEDRKCHSLTKEERQRLSLALKNFTLTVTGTEDLKNAVITCGGVMVKEIDPSTMESKKTAGLYFAGEMLDCDALTGGFNLQIAWSTGYLAGKSAANKNDTNK